MAPKANKIAFVFLKLAVSSVLLYIVIAKTGLKQVLETLTSMKPAAFVAAIFLYILAQWFSTLRWRLLLPGGIGLGKLFSLYMIGSFFNTFLPGIIGGDAVKGFYLFRATGRGSLALASIFMDRYIGFVVLITICAAAFPFGYVYVKGSPVVWILPVTILSFVIGSVLFFGLRIGHRIKFLSEFYSYFSLYRNQKGVIRKTVLWSFFVQFSGILAVYILSLGIGQRVPVLAFLVFLPIIILVSTLPISISGLGVREGAFVVLLGLIGVRPEAAAAISLSWFVTAAAGSLVGLVEYIRYKKERIDFSGEVQ
ncbi:MAG: lysylphosphatidylglycerol synthase transmembrane domain-containing protein [Nitrospirota bacterium]